jgi:predicted secreted protein
MTRQRGTAFLLKVSIGNDAYATVAGLKTTTLKINGEATPTPGTISGWRELMSGATRSLDIAASGIFTGSSAETQIKSAALAGSVEDYELSFESGEQLRGRFLITRLEYAGDYNGERNYTIALASSGEVKAA